MKRKRIFIGMMEIAGYYGQLTKGLREKGYAVTFVGGNAHPFGYREIAFKIDSGEFAEFKCYVSFHRIEKLCNPIPYGSVLESHSRMPLFCLS